MDDFISRKAVIDALEKEKPTPFVNNDGSIDPFGAGQQNQWYRDGIAIMNLPSAEPKRGQWINDINYIGWTCSNCQYHDGKLTDRYCPSCGARMYEGEEDK